MVRKVSAFRIDEEAKRHFKMAAAKAGMPEGELLTRLIGPWADAFLQDKANVPPPYSDHAEAAHPAPTLPRR